MIILDAPIKALFGSVALVLFYCLNMGIKPAATAVQIEVLAHSCKMIYLDLGVLPPTTRMFLRYMAAVGIVEIVIRPLVGMWF